MMKQTLAVLLLIGSVVLPGTSDAQSNQRVQVRPLAEYLVMYHEAVDHFDKQLGIKVQPGVYLAARGILRQRKDLQNLIDGGQWDNPYGNKQPILLGFAPGTLRDTRNELWAFHNGHYFPIQNQNGDSLRFAYGVPQAVFPAKGGAFLVTGQPKGSKKKLDGQLAFIPHKRSPGQKIGPFKNAPKLLDIDTYDLTSDGKSLIYISRHQSDDKLGVITLLAQDGATADIAQARITPRGLDAAFSYEGIFIRMPNQNTALGFIPLQADGTPDGLREVFRAVRNQQIIFGNNMPILMSKKSTGGAAHYMRIRQDGSVAQISSGSTGAGVLTPEARRVLETHGDDWVRRSAGGSFDDLIERPDDVKRMLGFLRGKQKTWVNLVGHYGVGKSDILRLLAHHVAKNRKQDGFLRDYEVFHLSLSVLVRLAKKPPQGNKPPPLEQLKQALFDKRVILVMDDFLDDPALGATNPTKSMDIFLMNFREAIAKGQLKVVTTADALLWNDLRKKNPQIDHMVNVMQMREPSEGMLKDILEVKLEVIGRHYRVEFKKGVLDVILKSSKELYPEYLEPYRSIRAIEDVARDFGSLDRKARVKSLTAYDVRSHFLGNVFDGKKLEGLDIDAMERYLAQRVFGQPTAMQRVLEEFNALTLGVTDRNRPLATLFFVGPTGVGKTYTAELLAQYLKVEMVKIDMNHFNGFDSGALYTQKIRALARKPYVLVLDEVDKAGSGDQVLNDLRSIFDKGVYAEGTKEELHFSNAIIVLTGNYGSQMILDNAGASQYELLGKLRDYVLDDKTPDNEKIPVHVWSRLEDSFIIFHGLTNAALEMVAKKFAKELDQQISARFNIRVIVSDKLMQYFVARSAKKKMGAVPVQNQIRKSLMNRIASKLTSMKRKDPVKFRNINEVYITLNSRSEIKILDNTQRGYDAAKRRDGGSL